jgi:hypothetical protein
VQGALERLGDTLAPADRAAAIVAGHALGAACAAPDGLARVRRETPTMARTAGRTLRPARTRSST